VSFLFQIDESVKKTLTEHTRDFFENALHKLTLYLVIYLLMTTGADN